MRRHVLAVFLVCILLSGLLPGIAEALTITNRGLKGWLSGAGDPISFSTNLGRVTAALGTTGGGGVLFYNATSADLLFFRTENNGRDTTNTVTIAGGGGVNAGRFNDLDAVGTTLIGCYSDHTEFDSFFIKSTNSGGTWASLTSIPGTSTDIGCGVAGSGSTYWYVGGNDTALVFRRSTDAGATWSSPATIDGTSRIQQGHAYVAAKNATHAVALYQRASTTDLRACRTTNGGSSWTCGTTLTTAAATTGAHDLDYDSSTDSYVISVSGIGVPVSVFSSSDDGATWAGGSVDSTQACFSTPATCTGSGGTSLITAPGIWAIFYGQQAVSGSEGFLRYAESTNEGATWTPETLISNRMATGPIGAALGTTGEIFFGVLNIFDTADATYTDGVPNNRLRIDEFTAPFTSAVIAPSAEVAVVNLVGFDVDLTGSTIMARVSNGPIVRSFEGNGLGEITSSFFTGVQTSCTGANAVDRVIAARELVAYISCDPAVPTDPIEFNIRSNTISDTSFPGCDDCMQTFNLNVFSDDGGDFLHEISDIIAFPIGLTTTKTPIAGGPVRVLAFGWSSNRGVIGVNTATFQEDSFTADHVENSDSIEVPYTSSAPEQLCVFEAPAGKTFLGAVDTLASTRLWRWDDDFEFTTGHERGPLETWGTASTTMGNAQGIGCGAERIIVVNERGSGSVDQVLVASFNEDTAGAAFTTLWGPVTVNGVRRGVALTNDGEFFAYFNNATEEVSIGYASNGTVTATLNADGKGLHFHSMKFDEDADNIYIATRDNITRYSVFPFTDGIEGPSTPCTINCPGAGDDGDDGLLGSAPQTIGSAIGVGAFGGGLLLSGMVILGMVGLGASAVRPAPLIGAGVGALVGVIIAWGMGFLDAAGLFAIIALAAISFYAYRRMASA